MASEREEGDSALIVGDDTRSARIAGLLDSSSVVIATPQHIYFNTYDEHLAHKREIAADLDDKLGALKSQIDELHRSALGGMQLSQEVKRLEGITATIERAGEIGRNLTADVVLPPAKDLRVKLVPSDSLDRLEEYRSDESRAYLLVGAFLGAALGILSNWVTQEAFTVTKISGAFLVFFVCMALLAEAWALQIGHRARNLKNRLLSIPEGEPGTKHVGGKERGKTYPGCSSGWLRHRLAAKAFDVRARMLKLISITGGGIYAALVR